VYETSAKISDQDPDFTRDYLDPQKLPFQRADGELSDGTVLDELLVNTHWHSVGAAKLALARRNSAAICAVRSAAAEPHLDASADRIRLEAMPVCNYVDLYPWKGADDDLIDADPGREPAPCGLRHCWRARAYSKCRALIMALLHAGRAGWL